MSNHQTFNTARLALAFTAAHFLSPAAGAAEQLKNGDLPAAPRLNDSSIKALIAGTGFVVREIKNEGTVELRSGDRFSKNFENDRERASRYVNSGSPSIIVEVRNGVFTSISVAADHAYDANSATKEVAARFTGKVGSADNLNTIERELARAVKEDINRMDLVNQSAPRAGKVSELVVGTGFRVAGQYFDRKDKTKWVALLNNNSEFSNRFSKIHADEIRRSFGAPFLSLKVSSDGTLTEIMVNAGKFNSTNGNGTALKNEFVGKPISTELLGKFSAAAHEAVVAELDKEIARVEKN